MFGVQAETPDFAATVGRGDYMIVPSGGYDTGGTVEPSPIAPVQINGWRGLVANGVSGDVSGRISVGILGGFVIAIAAFYIWTHPYQK